MKSILEQFANGNINPAEGFIKKGSHYERMANEEHEKETQLIAAMDEGLKELFLQYTDLQKETAAMSETDSFIYGYRLGALMIMDVFNGKEDSICRADLFQNAFLDETE